MLIHGLAMGACLIIDETKRQGVPLVLDVLDAGGNEHALALALYAVVRQPDYPDRPRTSAARFESGIKAVTLFSHDKKRIFRGS